MINSKYLVLDNSTRYYIFTGGRGSGKSYAVSMLMCLLATEPGHTILFTRYTLRAASISIIPEFLEKIDVLNMRDAFTITKDEIVHIGTGSRILFRGIKTSSGDQTANLKSIQGVTTWVLDEAEELTDESIFDKIDLSVRQKGVQNRVVMIMNPATKEHWIYKRFFEVKGVSSGVNTSKDDVTYVHTDYRDNKENLSESYLNQIEAIKRTNPDKYNHVILGGWRDKAEGVVFKNWSYGKFNPDELQTSCGLDFGFSVDPDTLIEVAIDKAKKVIYLKQHIYQTGLRHEVLAELVKSKIGSSLVIADSADPRLIESLRYKGINIRAVKKGKIEEGITMMLDYDIVVEENSQDIGKELNNYVYVDRKSNMYIDAYNHCFVGETLITTITGQKPIKDIKVGDLVLTRKGYKKVLKKFNNGYKKTIEQTMQFDTNTLSLVGTNNHKIWTHENWQELSKLKPKDKVCVVKSLTENNTNSIKTKGISAEEVREYTELSGNTIKEKSLKDIIYTTLTETQATITSKILQSSVKNYTLNTRVKKDLQKIKSGLMTFIVKALKKLKNGINQKRVKNGISNMEKKHGKIENIELLNVKNAGQNTKQDTQEYPNTATTIVKLKQTDVKDKGVQKVYDLMIEDCHEYFANGILVHNCIDAARYNITFHLENPSLGSYSIR